MKHKIIGGSEALEKPKGTFGQGGTHESGKPGGGGYWWIIFFVAAAIIVANQVKKENPDLNIPGDQELFEKLPDDAKEAFTESYGQPENLFHPA